MNKPLPPTVCLDGSSIRRIREEKKLTQLYVAKVVGVTTDTISRWENNRYPSVKRENALRLAEALEVPVEDVLESGTGECPFADSVEEPPAEPPSPAVPRYIIPLVSLLFVVVAILYFFRNGDEFGTVVAAERHLPLYAAPGSVIPVQVVINAETANRGLILREKFPSGWTLVESSPPPSSLDNVEGMARWILKSGERDLRIAYLLKIGEKRAENAEETFHGDVVSRSGGGDLPMTVGGAMTIRIAPIHWADMDGNHVIDDSEMLHATDWFEEMHDVHLDWDLLENLWDAKSYEWDDREKKFRPLKATHPPPPAD